MGEEICEVVGQDAAHRRRALAQDGRARLDIGQLQIRNQPPLEARDESLLQPLNLARRPVAGEDDLFVPLVQRVERVEELL